MLAFIPRPRRPPSRDPEAMRIEAPLSAQCIDTLIVAAKGGRLVVRALNPTQALGVQERMRALGIAGGERV